MPVMELCGPRVPAFLDISQVFFTHVKKLIQFYNLCHLYYGNLRRDSYFFFLQRALMNLPPLQVDARLRIDIKATATIAITIIAYIACYVPAIVFAVLGLKH